MSVKAVTLIYADPSHIFTRCKTQSKTPELTTR